MSANDRIAALRAALKERILVLDGAMGTAIQAANLAADDFGGPALEGCNEHLVLTRPDVIESIHRGYLEAGADIIETDTFGGTRVVLAEYGLQDKVYEINFTAAQLGRRAADALSTTKRPRFVAGSMGPGTKTISVTGGITFDEVRSAFLDQTVGLVEGGSDVDASVLHLDGAHVPVTSDGHGNRAACGLDDARRRETTHAHARATRGQTAQGRARAQGTVRQAVGHQHDMCAHDRGGAAAGRERHASPAVVRGGHPFVDDQRGGLGREDHSRVDGGTRQFAIQRRPRYGKPGRQRERDCPGSVLDPHFSDRVSAKGTHPRGQSGSFQRRHGMGVEASAAHLRPGERLALHEQHPCARAGEQAGGQRPCGPCADRDDVPGVRRHRRSGAHASSQRCGQCVVMVAPASPADLAIRPASAGVNAAATDRAPST